MNIFEAINLAKSENKNISLVYEGRKYVYNPNKKLLCRVNEARIGELENESAMALFVGEILSEEWIVE